MIYSLISKALIKEYRKKRQVADTLFYGRLRIQKEKELKKIRQEELEKMEALMTPNKLRERAFNPPEGPIFKTRIECIQ